MSGWATVPLKRVASFRVSNVDKKTVDGEQPVRLCNYTDVYHRDTIRPNQEFMSATASREQVAAFRLRPGDVIITKDSETADDIGVPTYVEAAALDLVCGYHLALIRPVDRAIDGRFLFWSMASAVVRDQLAASATGVTRFGLRSDSIGGVLIPLPTVQEQRAIADFLDAETARIDALIAKRQELAQLLQSRASSSIEATVQTLRSQSVCVRVKYFLQEIDERLDNRDPIELLSVSIHRGVVPRSSIVEDLPESGELSGFKVCHRGDVVINRMRAFHGGLGRAPMRGIVSPEYTVLRPMKRADSRFLHYILRSPWFIGKMNTRLRGIGSADQGNVRTPRINFSDLGLIPVPLPPLSTQHQLAASLDAEMARINSTVRALLRQITLLEERRQALITAAVTGELDIAGAA